MSCSKWMCVLWLICVSMVIEVSPTQKTIWEIMQNNNRLRKIQGLIKQHNLSHMFERTGITAFLPTTTAFLYFDQKTYGYNMDDTRVATSFLSYHIAHGIIYEKDVADNKVTDSLHTSGFKLHFNTFTDGNKLIHAVNGAILSVVDIQASNGVLHIIDRVIAPISSNQTLHDYMLKPEIPHLSFVSISRASIVDMTLKEQTRNNNYKFTAFAPNDSVLLPMPDYGQDVLFSDLLLLKTVIRAHMLSDYVQFLPGRGHIQSHAAKNGTLHFERRNGEVYVKNNMVRARVVQANIPVSNGVLHVVDNLLYFIYQNIVQKLQSMPETSGFGAYLRDIPPAMKTYLQDTNTRFTVFAPNNEAFAKVPYLEQKTLSIDLQKLSEVLGAHILPDVNLKEAMIGDHMTFTTMTNKTLSISRINSEIYVECGGVQSKVELTDVPCTNGIVFVIRNVLSMRNFTVWEAIVGNVRLTTMASILNNTDVMTLLSTPTEEDQRHVVTAFLPGDSAIHKIPSDMRTLLKERDTDRFVEALRGHVIDGQKISSLDVTSMIGKRTMNGETIELENLSKGFVVIGSHILAKVVVKDIWCNNGILHIIDDLIHLPTRNIMEEMVRYNDLRVLSALFSRQETRSVWTMLQMEDAAFTVFVPVDEAFESLPKLKADKIINDIPFLKKVLKAHVVPNVSLYAEEFLDGDLLLAEEESIHVMRNSTEVVIINNNVRAKILKSNIRATNGKIHVIDSLLYFPYLTVEETMTSDDRYKEFYNMLKNIPEFIEMAKVENYQMTIFVPSATFLNTIPQKQFDVIKASPDVIRQIFVGHVIPGTRLDSMFLRQHFIVNYIVRSQYNTTFEFLEKNAVTTIDVGYSNLRHRLNIIRNGLACSNGILYTIDGFLSWSLHNIMHELRSQASLKYAAEHFMKLLPSGVEAEFIKNDTVYTVFHPSDGAFSKLGHWDKTHITTQYNYTERQMLYSKHIINGTIWTYRDLLHSGNVSLSMLDEGVYFVIKNHDAYPLIGEVPCIGLSADVYLHWNNIEAKIIQSNILASNGIIHIIDRIFIKGEKPEITTTIRPPEAISCASINCTSIGALTILLVSLFLITVKDNLLFLH